MMRTMLALVLLALGTAGVVADGADEAAVRKVLSDTFDKPEARLLIDPVATAGDHAIAGWSQGDMGGRALLRRRHGQWSLILCGGDGIKSAQALQRAGVPLVDAKELAGKLAAAESRLPPARLALFAKFEGTVMMNADGTHPPTQHSPPHGMH